MSKPNVESGMPVGPWMPDWKGAGKLGGEVLEGGACRVEPLDAERHSGDLWEAFRGDDAGWVYLRYGPFERREDLEAWIRSESAGKDPLYYAIVDKGTGCAVGVASYLLIREGDGVVEVGHLHYSKQLQKTRAATEAMYLMMKRAFELGYRRYEWKCDAMNAGSCKAAVRLGFKAEGVHRQVTMYKGRSRDTAWFSVIDSEWEGLRKRFEAWLRDDNFDAQGRQKKRLGEH